MSEEVFLIPLSQLMLSHKIQPRRIKGNDGEYKIVDRGHVNRLKKSDPAYWEPIRVTPRGDGKFYVLDGYHRAIAAHELGLSELRAVIVEFEDGSPIDLATAYELAFEYNVNHGLPLSTEDRKSFAVWLHAQNPDLSLRELGRRTGLSHNTVKRALEGPDEKKKGSKPDPLDEAARRAVKYLDVLWEEGKKLDGSPVAEQAAALGIAAIDRWEKDTALMLERTTTIVNRAREYLL